MTVRVSVSPLSREKFAAVYAANGALSLLNVCLYLLDRQLRAQAAAFEREGGFTERLYRRRTRRRKSS
ncbi:four helix bundle suffix domain-containing protein [Kiritimatiella glycovorans]|uniref:four helix bundle suffix domain-containing protein n=1 Tax=Kiritimatiella glycovorans TaxID=1307763 RepID=UPI001F2DDEFF|nr:four helix bundle suffix domain-containing protein [Kiritimatiella glycovorans]